MFNITVNASPKNSDQRTERRIPGSDIGLDGTSFEEELFDIFGNISGKGKKEEDPLKEQLEMMNEFFEDLAEKVLRVREPRVIKLTLVSVDNTSDIVKEVGVAYVKETEIEGIELWKNDPTVILKTKSQMYYTTKMELMEGSLVDIIQKELN